MYQENEMLLPVTAAFCAEEEKKKNNSTNSGTHQRFRVRVHARKERCFDENALAGLFMGLGKSVEDSTNLPLAPCD